MDLEKFIQEQIDCLKKEEEKYGQLEEYEKGEMFAYKKIKQALTIPAVVGQSEQFYCTCSRAKGLDHDEEGMPYCIECQKPVQ